MFKPKLIRITTVPISLEKLISGQMAFMGNKGFEVSMVSSDFKDSDILSKKEHADFIPVNMTRRITPLADLRALYQLIDVFRRIKPSIVHTHTPKAGLLGMVAAKMAGVPIRLHTVAGLPLMEATGPKRKLLEAVEKITYACATFVYPNSGNLKDFIIASGFSKPEKLKVIGNGSSNGINTEEFKRAPQIDEHANAIKAQYRIKEEDFIFVFIGRLVKHKGIEELVSAFSVLNKKDQNVKLLLVGPQEEKLDPLSSGCLREIEENPAIIAVGYQTDVKPYLSLSKALVFPSYREGFPNVPMQAGCFDLPCIVTNINGCNEIIVNGENGLIIPVKDRDALLSAMETLYLDKTLYPKMASIAREMIVKRYDQERVWQLILEEYKKHLKNNGVV
ncbi:glycosyltransferase family 4 protein [Pedobacter frigoris]|uniref:glycosyltransferase family 4 protein n=1 Tax=Pedobacter frigoris TaxID=2571272 RepID=UPI0029306330|nr:glycosyltransferase family 4 protein [Pedobacter frigoris]